MSKKGTAPLSNWYIDVSFKTETPMDEEAGFDILDALAGFHASPAVGSHGGTIAFTVEAPDALNATTMVPNIMEKVKSITGEIDIAAVDVLSEVEFTHRLNEPEIPDLVGLTEIAEMANVSRQRANAIVKQASFPAAVLVLAAGQFRTRAAVENWIENWSRKPGRKPGASTSTSELAMA